MQLRAGHAVALAAVLSAIIAVRLFGSSTNHNDLFNSVHQRPSDSEFQLLDWIASWLPDQNLILLVIIVKYVLSSRCRCPLCTPPFRPKYKFVKMLGAGSFARVLLVAKEHGGSAHHRKPRIYLPFAVKQAVVEDVTDCNEGMFEMELLLRVEHPSLVKVEDQFFHKERRLWKTSLYYCIVMEYCGGGDLFDLIDRAVKYHGGLTEKECLEMFTQILEGVEFMHSKNIMHRDLKPDNILISSNGDLKIADLGLGEKLRTKVVRAGYAGTEGYIAPEVWQGHAYGKACDVWSLGVLLFTMISWLDIMELLRDEGLARSNDDDCIEVLIRNPTAIDMLLSKVEFVPTVHDLLRRMLVLKPKLRATCAQLLQSESLRPYRRQRNLKRRGGSASNSRRGSGSSPRKQSLVGDTSVIAPADPAAKIDWDGASTPPGPLILGEAP